MTFCILLVGIACMYYVLRAPRKIGAKVFTYLLTYYFLNCGHSAIFTYKTFIILAYMICTIEEEII